MFSSGTRHWRGGQHGFTLLELMFSLVILGTMASAMTFGFLQMQQRNWDHEVRSGAMCAAQQVLDRLRTVDPSTMPGSGTISEEIFYIDRTYRVETTYCAQAALCTSNNIRHLSLGVSHLGQTRYRVETVFAQLR